MPASLDMDDNVVNTQRNKKSTNHPRTHQSPSRLRFMDQTSASAKTAHGATHHFLPAVSGLFFGMRYVRYSTQDMILTTIANP